MPAAPDRSRPLRAVLRPTTVIEASKLSSRLGAEITIVTESFQHTGSFKFRAAYNVASQVAHDLLITASSGNFGQALAYACQVLRKSCIVVMPSTAARVKIEAVREYGGRVDLIDTSRISRAQRVRELGGENPDAYLASAYDDPLVIEGNATLGEEIAALGRSFDFVVAPIGGGGLTAGLLVGLRHSNNQTPVIAAEPLLGNDAAHSFRAGKIISNESESQTLADGARTVSVGTHNWEVLQHGLVDVIEVNEDQIREAVRLLFSRANLKSEPTGALSLGALLAAPGRFRSKSVCCVVSGGNVDPQVFRELLE